MAVFGEVSGAPGMAMAPTEGPKQTPVSNDINSLAAVALCCLGHFWWPHWWTQVGSHSRPKRPPAPLVSNGFQKWG